MAACSEHHRLDSASASSKLLLAEALLLAEQFEAAMATYRKMLEEDSHSQEARAGLAKAEKLLKRSKVFIHTHTHTYIYIYMYTYTYIYMYIYIFIYTYTHTHTHTHIYIYIYIYIYI